MSKYLALLFVTSKASLSGGFISQFPTHPYFGNSAEEFHPHETLSTPMKLLSSLSLHQDSAISAYLIPMKLYEIPIETGLSECEED